MKSLAIYTCCFVALFLAVAFAVSLDAAGVLFFGWIDFLVRVLRQISPSPQIVAVSAGALLLFAVGVHWLGRTSYNSPERKWRVRWTLSIVVLVFILFGAGTAMIGIVHQTGWLLSAEDPITGTTLRYGYGSPNGNMKEFAGGFTSYSQFQASLPPGGTFFSDGRAKHSWETYLLSYMWYDIHEIDMERSWNDPVNESQFKRMAPMFINPAFRTVDIVDANGYGLSHYAANVRILGPNRSVPLKDMANGAAHTILVGEVNGNFKPWGDPVNWRDPAKGINTGPNSFGGARGAQFLMADGSVRFQSETTDPELLKALADPARSERTDLDP
jgi:hypothetical protein